MDDMTAFERQVAGAMVQRAGPIQPVDDATLFAATVATPRWRFRPILSATKFGVAGVIVALFGGFLLAGVLTTQEKDTIPAATESDESMVPVFVTVGQKEAWGSYGTLSDPEDEYSRLVNGALFGYSVATDPRLEGEWILTRERVWLDEDAWIQSEALILANEGGRWIGGGVAAEEIDDDSSTTSVPLRGIGGFQTVLAGVDGYEGLTAILWQSDESDGLNGVIVSDRHVPAIPEDWCAVARDDFSEAMARMREGASHGVPDGWAEDHAALLCPSVEIPR